MTTTDIRPSPIAGQWYPGNSKQLTRMIGNFMKAVDPIKVEGEIVGLLAPHAGYLYSGGIAAHAFSQVRGQHFDRVVVISPMHHAYTHPILTSAHAAYRTPLGDIPVDHQMLAALKKKIPIRKIRRDPEHSLEIELPFLQYALKEEFSLVPLMLRDQSYDRAAALGGCLADLIRSDGKKTLIIASSDLSHFYRQSEALMLDSTILDRIAAHDPAGVIRAEEEGTGFACGRGAIAAMLVATGQLGGDQVRILKHGTSGDTTGDMTRVVGYAAAAVYQGK